MNLRSIHSAMTWKLVSATTALGSSLAMLTGRRNAWPDGRLHDLFPHVVEVAMRGNDAAPGSLVSDVDLGSVRVGGVNSGIDWGVWLCWASALAARVELRSSHP